MTKNKKKLIFLIGILITIGICIGVSYALWVTTTTQQSVNKITSNCLQIELLDKTAAIQLENAYPLRDQESKQLIPYEFTIKNTCDSLITYDVNLEIMNLGENQLATQFVSASIDNGLKKRLGEQPEVIASYKDATYTANEARNLLKRKELTGNSEQTYSLRIWMDSSVTAKDPVMNKEFLAKISLVSSITEARGTLMIRRYNENPAFWKYKENIVEVIFEDKLNPKETKEDFIFDVSKEKNGSVMSYLVETESSAEETPEYILYIQGKGGVKANSDSSSLFQDFNHLRSIKGLEFLDTSEVTNMAQMFYNCKSLVDFDVSHFDTSQVISMSNMFYECNSLVDLDVSRFDTSKVTNMHGLFWGCGSLVKLDVSSFDTSQVTTLNSMFIGCSNLSSVTYGENFIHMDGADTVWMFAWSKANKPTHVSWNGVEDWGGI